MTTHSIGTSTIYNGFEEDIIIDDENPKDIATYSNGSIYPYPMPEEVDIREEVFSVYEWLRKLNRQDLVTDPEFQRNRVWRFEQKSQFIESVLLNIPLPPIYVNQNREGKYILVDGLQRTSTFEEFVVDNGFALRDLRVLSDLNEKRFTDLPTLYQTKIEDKKFTVYVIKPSVPLAMVYDIFHRINTGGTQLTRQEIRNCIYTGTPTRLLQKLSAKSYFRSAIGNGISPVRMKDQEAVLRCLAFRIFDYETDYKGDMDEFLGDTMVYIKTKMDDNGVQKLEHDFECVMRLTYEFFGEQNFRLPTKSTKGRINIALMESVAYFFANTPKEILQQHKAKILENYDRLLSDPTYLDAIQSSTGDRKRVKNRFDLARKILGAF